MSKKGSIHYKMQVDFHSSIEPITRACYPNLVCKLNVTYSDVNETVKIFFVIEKCKNEWVNWCFNE